MPRLLNIIRNRNRHQPVAVVPVSPSVESDAPEVVEDLTALSSTSNSSPTNSNVSEGNSFGRKKTRNHFPKGSSQIFRRVTSSRKNGKQSGSVFPSLDEVSQVSSLSSPFSSERTAYKKSEKVELLLQPKKKYKTTKKNKKANSDGSEEALSKLKKEIATKDAKIQYLDTLVKELKSLYTERLDMKDMELSALRKEHQKANEELSRTKENLTEVMDGQAKLINDFTKKSKEANCWFGGLPFN
ncbi:MAG: hypothetical protein SGILL_000958 [Bacillariaceae sp.]